MRGPGHGKKTKIKSEKDQEGRKENYQEKKGNGARGEHKGSKLGLSLLNTSVARRCAHLSSRVNRRTVDCLPTLEERLEAVGALHVR